VPAVNAYDFCGIAFAVWAVTVSFIGITREDFPNSAGAQRIVAAISISLALATVGTAIYTGATEDDEPSGGEGHALVLPL
jgi:hypothetical protein